MTSYIFEVIKGRFSSLLTQSPKYKVHFIINFSGLDNKTGAKFKMAEEFKMAVNQ
jgi:hypothetical protein